MKESFPHRGFKGGAGTSSRKLQAESGLSARVAEEHVNQKGV